MNKIITTIIFLFILVSSCFAQDKIILTSGDTLEGNIYRIDEHRFRIYKVDGNSAILADTFIAKVIPRDSIKVQTKPLVQPNPSEIGAGDYLIKASRYHYISLAMYACGGFCYCLYLAQEEIINPPLYNPILPLAAGFGFGIIGFTYQQLAWMTIADAGKKLNSKKLSVRIAPTGFGICYRL